LGSESGFSEFTYYPNNTAMSSRFADEIEDQETLRSYMTTEGNPQDKKALNELIFDRMIAQRRHCKVMSLSNLVEQEGIVRIDLLKIDVEKAEMDVLSGIDDRTWSMISQIVIEVHDIAGRVNVVLERLRKRGFSVSIDRDPRLLKTNCFNVYGYKGRERQDVYNAYDTVPSNQGASRLSLINDLSNSIRKNLSEEMLPQHFVLLGSMPRNGEGSPDYERLKEIRIRREEILPPISDQQTIIESRLVSIWREIFGESNVTVDSDFFDLGGNSLTAVRLIAHVENIFGEGVLSPDIIFSNGTLRHMAAAIVSELFVKDAAQRRGHIWKPEEDADNE
jgi:FkbM family methyltransferase